MSKFGDDQQLIDNIIRVTKIIAFALMFGIVVFLTIAFFFPTRSRIEAWLEAQLKQIEILRQWETP